ncbi:hypothetical protein [Aliiroseovarius lamellibrachiae]|uniref:hypothetical protein n=1 Tax=Aliiroseovarius lamellibrachiae TaxID=1924933 RepID=UPI001BE0524F|nr:hypothetical protein [Aliiroseovarius lamellibrachiae]MBT2129900.1 hypothetical protein [Aliiroseovarius lamellibrachiae]
MKQIAKYTVLVVGLALGMSAPTFAEDGKDELKEGADLMSRGFQLLLDGLTTEMAPIAEELAEGWQDLLREMEDMTAYYPPETLPNGDIIIRRKDPVPPDQEVPGETEL